MSKVLITGGSGFVGRALTRKALEEGAEVTVLCRPGRAQANAHPLLRSLEGDFCDSTHMERLLAEVRPECCIHLAWYAEPGSYLRSRQNLDFAAATAQFCWAAAEHGCTRFVGVGTCFELGDSPHPLADDAVVSPRHLYSAAKAAARLLVEQIAAEHGMEAAWARLFYLYGPHEDPRRLVSGVTKSLLLGESVATTHGEQLRDFLHVEDEAAALWTIARSHLTGPVHVGSGLPVRVRDVVEQLGTLTGRFELLRIGARAQDPKDPMMVCADPRRLRDELHFSPSIGLTEGLEDTVRWWRQTLGVGG